MHRDKYLSTTEMERLRHETEKRASESVTARLDWLCVDLALQTGLRVNELAKITPEDIDLDREFLYVWRSKKRRPARDMVGLSPSMVAHLARHLGWLQILRTPYRDTIWPGQRGPWSRRALQQAWDRSCVRAGLAISGIHKARNTLATRLLSQCGNMKLVQMQLGHESMKTTESLYAAVPFEDRVAALKGVFG
jgi:integrase